jgi:hypothetical protein
MSIMETVNELRTKPFQIYIHQNAEVIVGKSIQTNSLTFTTSKNKVF